MRSLLALLLVGACATTPPPDTGSVVVEGPGIPPDGMRTAIVTVVVSDATGAVVNRTEPKGLNATFHVDVPDDGMVTVFTENSGAISAAHTWTHVKSTDHLFDPDYVPAMTSFQVPATIPALAGASSYKIDVLCPHGGSLSVPTMPSSDPWTILCPSDATMASAVITAKVGGQTWFALAPAIALDGTGTVAFQPYQQAVGLTATFSVPDDVGDGTTELVTSLVAGPDRAMTLGYGAGTTLMAGPALSAAVDGTVLASVDVQDGVTSQHHIATIERRYTTLPTTLQVGSSELLPAVTIARDDQSLWSGITWSIPAQAPYAVLEADIPAVRNNGAHWTLLAPAGAGSMRFPALPTDLAVDELILTSVTIVDDPAIADYDAARAMQAPPIVTGTRRTSVGRF